MDDFTALQQELEQLPERYLTAAACDNLAELKAIAQFLEELSSLLTEETVTLPKALKQTAVDALCTIQELASNLVQNQEQTELDLQTYTADIEAILFTDFYSNDLSPSFSTPQKPSLQSYAAPLETNQVSLSS